MVDFGAGMVYRPVVNGARPHVAGAAGSEAVRPKTYRRPASPEETKRRQEWGAKWGKLVSEAVRKAIGEAEQ